MEAQAAGRVHRLGQTKEVFIRRIAFRDSVETMVVAVQSAVKAGNLSKFEWVRVQNLIVRQPVMTDEVKSILRAHGMHQPHAATTPKPDFTDGAETCGRCGRKCRLEECAPAAAAAAASGSSSSDESAAAQGSGSGGGGSSTATGSSSAGAATGI
jgi:uncharacterized membrane protein YgcG